MTRPLDNPEGLSDAMRAAYDFVETMVPKSDLIANNGGHLWYGWALRDAFVAGSAWQQKENNEDAWGDNLDRGL